MATNLGRATPEQKADLIRLLVEPAEAKDRLLMTDAIVWTPPVRPFFEQVDDVAERPRTDSGAREAKSSTRSLGTHRHEDSAPAASAQCMVCVNRRNCSP